MSFFKNSFSKGESFVPTPTQEIPGIQHSSQNGSLANPILAAGEAELRRMLADLLLGEELARKVYGELDHAK